MKVRILNGPRGQEQSVMWKEDKDADLERKTIRVVDICLGEEVDGVFQPRQARQRMQFPQSATEAQIATTVEVRGGELENMLPSVIEPVDIEIGG